MISINDGDFILNSKDDTEMYFSYLNDSFYDYFSNNSDKVPNNDIEGALSIVHHYFATLLEKHNQLQEKVRKNINPNYDIYIYIDDDGLHINLFSNIEGKRIKTLEKMQFDEYKNLIFENLI